MITNNISKINSRIRSGLAFMLIAMITPNNKLGRDG